MELTKEYIALQLERLQALQDCRNLMGTYSHYHCSYRHKDYIELWAKREDTCLEMPWGIYDGWEGVRRCYSEDHGDRSDPATYEHLKGAMFMHQMDTEVLVVAEDGETARGCWITPGHETFNGKDENGNPCTVAGWCWGKYAVDFIKEDGVWKLWHMRLYPLFMAPYEGGWAKSSERAGSLDNRHSTDRPQSKDLWRYSKDAVYPADQPDPPKPYKTFADVGLTFIDPKE